MKLQPTELAGVRIVEPRVHRDERGFFAEMYHRDHYDWVPEGGMAQVNHSHSILGTLRGLHFQEPNAQGKLVWVVAGTVFDVAVDVRVGSPTFSRWVGVELSAENGRQLWIPCGFAHGFLVTSDEADVLYACTSLYDATTERSVAWDDPDIGVDWPGAGPLLSPKDAQAPKLADALVLPRLQDYPDQA